MEEGLWVYAGGLPKMIMTPSSPWGPARSHLTVVTKTEAGRYGGGRHRSSSLLSLMWNIHKKINSKTLELLWNVICESSSAVKTLRYREQQKATRNSFTWLKKRCFYEVNKDVLQQHRIVHSSILMSLINLGVLGPARGRGVRCMLCLRLVVAVLFCQPHPLKLN